MARVFDGHESSPGDGVVRQRFATNKQAGAALDPHGCVADYDSFTGVLTLYSSTQSIYMVRDVVADVLQIPRTKVGSSYPRWARVSARRPRCSPTR